jgi:UDP-glucose 4-epimerase
VHLEVKQHVPRPTARDRAEFTNANVGGTTQWLDWATLNGIPRFVYVSSVKAVRAGGGLTREDADPETSDPYGRSKAEAEAAVREWAAAAADRTAVILRFAPVYGPSNQANLAAFTKQIILGRPSLAGDGRAKKSILSRENAVEAVYHALHRIRGRCELFNVADPRPIALCDLASLIAGCCDAPPPRRIPRLLATAIARAGDAFEALTGREFALDSRRLRVLLSDSVFPIDKLLQSGFVPQQSTADGIAEMAAWVRDQG